MRDFMNDDRRGAGPWGPRRRGGHHPGGGFGPGPQEGAGDDDFAPRPERTREQMREERRRGRRGFGPGAGFDEGAFGPRGPMGGLDLGAVLEGRGPRGRGHRGPGRGRKGDVRNAVLALLRDEQLNGYGLINAIAERSDGLWRPGAGSVYPALGLLEDEGLIEPAEQDGKKVYRLTEDGRRHVSEHEDELESPWDKVSEPHRGFLDVRSDMHQLGMAVQQVVVAGDQHQLEATRKVLERARKDVYRILAEDGDQE